MNSSLAWLRTRSSVTKLLIHLVLAVKYRRSALTNEILTDTEAICREVAHKNGVTVVEFGGESDHIHMLIQIPPTLALCDVVKSLKGNTSRYLRIKHHNHLHKFLWGKHLWSPSYCAVSCGGATLEKIRSYIESQDRPP